MRAKIISALKKEHTRTLKKWKRVHKASLTDEDSDSYDEAQRLSGTCNGLIIALTIVNEVMKEK